MTKSVTSVTGARSPIADPRSMRTKRIGFSNGVFVVESRGELRAQAQTPVPDRHEHDNPRSLWRNPCALTAGNTKMDRFARRAGCQALLRRGVATSGPFAEDLHPEARLRRITGRLLGARPLIVLGRRQDRQIRLLPRLGVAPVDVERARAHAVVRRALHAAATLVARAQRAEHRDVPLERPLFLGLEGRVDDERVVVVVIGDGVGEVAAADRGAARTLDP